MVSTEASSILPEDHFDIKRCPMPERPMTQRMSIYIGHHGGEWQEWYVGISPDPERALFIEHRVDRETGEYRYLTALDPKMAQKIKDYYVGKGMSNGVRSPPDCSIVYLYRMVEGTVQ